MKKLLVNVALLAGAVLGSMPLRAAQPENCGRVNIAAKLRVDQGHPWRPPFGLDRVGALPVAHVELDGSTARTDQYELVAYQDSREIERHALSFSRNPLLYAGHGFTPTVDPAPPFFAHAPLSFVPSEVSLWRRCQGDGRELVRQKVGWPEIEVDAIARPDRRVNPVDLGAIFPPHDWLLLAQGQSTTLEIAVMAHLRDLPNARVRAWFDHGKPVEKAISLARGEKADQIIRLPFSAKGERSMLHVRLSDGSREFWRKDVHVMIAEPVRRATFGAVEMKLRYDLPILAVDPKTGVRRPSVDYNTAWDKRFSDIVVYLPNGSRFVFWRGANYIPFWASPYNAGALYQWVEDCSGGLVSHPDGSKDCAEPLFDSELRYSRVRIMESTASRVHVRWDYQLTDASYEVRRGGAAEDFYFYPDGFGTRVVTAPTVPGNIPYLSEFQVVTPPAAFPLEVLPTHMIEALPLDSGKVRVELPLASVREVSAEGRGWPPPELLEPREKPMVYRLFAHKHDPAAAIYFHPTDPAVPHAFVPLFDQAQRVTPAYWGNHWPLNRGKWTGWSINDDIAIAPGHNSIAMWMPRKDAQTGSEDWEVEPLTNGRVFMPDEHGRVRPTNLPTFVWMIAYADIPDETLRNWGKSFSTPPAVEVTGGRLDVPSYSVQRRALRLVAESSSIEMKLNPLDCTQNPVFEIDQAPTRLASVTLDGRNLSANEYAWDGRVLWVNAAIQAPGVSLRIRFNGTT